MFSTKYIICTTLLLCWSLTVQAQLDANLKNANIPKSVSPDVPIDENVTNASTTSSTTTTAATTTTTQEPITSTTTTAKPTPTTSTTSTTTEAPSTTTPSPVPTTTPKPTPFPAPSVGTWNSSCIALKMAAQLNFTYETKENKLATGLYNIPSDAKVEDFSCENKTIQSIELMWGPDEAKHSLTLTFEKVNGSSVLSTISIHLPLLSDNFPDAKENETILMTHTKPEFSTPEKMSYHCTRVQKFNLTENIGDVKAKGVISVSQVQAEAFRVSNTTAFSTVHDCDSSETSDVVPIAVGIALAALILVVLISYLCARRRSTSRGYMSF
ncbi:lysosome-associated membrane glycoprotein 1-like [Scaptodrosophila lebanonensis]|uniref:Lysosome-associated membrane glycoprotein 5 n=1 Tax=Drosophila lebanonensis TaxID=7225 RepID=A0A6J2TFJ4_DROLE|nr:lysosome-associated membrane glycoprotein 1-like [Scaptodrosophila lebanonensis]